MSAGRVINLFHTIRYLRLRQIFFRIYYLLRKPKLPSIATPEKNSLFKSWHAPQAMAPSMLGPNEFQFIGESGELIGSNDWNNTKHSKLWLYNLHYFDDLNSLNSDARCVWHSALIDNWINENPPTNGNGWEPYPLSLRIVNWIKWFSQKDHIEKPWLDSLVLQAKALEQQLEFHILGNHLFANAKALVFVGSYFQGSQANEWLTDGIKILDREIKEQFFPDGGHFELSPMYHSILIWDMCDLVQLAETCGNEVLASRSKAWKDIIVQGLKWLSKMIHPDGKISFFNDTAFNASPNFNIIRSYAEQLGCIFSESESVSSGNPIVTHLENSGYVVVEAVDYKAILDVGHIGPDYQPGHAHADNLSFELSILKQRVFVNSGTSLYGEGAERLRQRGTSAHNSVTIEGENSSEIWSSFRVARRAYPFDFCLVKNEELIKIGCSHNGYFRMVGRNIHRREWEFKNNTLLLTDTISGSFREAEARLYLHPQVKVVEVDSKSVNLLLPNRQQTQICLSGHSSIFIENSYWNENFGVSTPNHCIVVKFVDSKLLTKIEWSTLEGRK